MVTFQPTILVLAVEESSLYAFANFTELLLQKVNAAIGGTLQPAGQGSYSVFFLDVPPQ